MPTGRFIVKVVCWLIAGVFASLLVAFVGAASAPLGWFDEPSYIGFGRRGRLQQAGPRVYWSVNRTWLRIEGEAAESGELAGVAGPGAAAAFLPPPFWLPAPSGADQHTWVQACGWPWPAMSAGGSNSNRSAARHDSSPIYGAVWFGRRITLPLQPVWAGIAGNAAVLAAAGAAVWWVRGVAVRQRRVRRGLCPACGYDVRTVAGTVCPECGGSCRYKPTLPAG